MEGQFNHSPEVRGNYSKAPTTVAAAAAYPSSCGGGGGGGGVRYKLMSPAKLSISRSPCTLTIPPGLSPTSFLKSPVLLSNIKALGMGDVDIKSGETERLHYVRKIIWLT